MKQPVVLVLAAGRGSRFVGDTHKLLAPWGEATVLESTLSAVESSGLPWRIVLSASLKAQVEGERIPLPRGRVVQAPLVPVGMGHSIAAGVAATPDAGGWLVLPADLPAIQARTLNAVADALRAQAGGTERGPVAVVPVWTTPVGKKIAGHPVGFPADASKALLALSGDSGGRQVLAGLNSVDVPVEDPGIVTDIDTVDDWQRARPKPPGLQAVPASAAQRSVAAG
jgi:molybdenum cofactor cytidylyltransferase